eukprot:scaffold12310_cov32-Attheya_sp.AAC.3
MMSEQEVCHLILSEPLVSSTHRFVRIGMNNNSKKLIVEDDDKEVDDGEDHEKNGNRSTVKISLIDAYGSHILSESWLHDTVFEEYLIALLDMSLFDFADKFCVGERGAHHNKIKRHIKDNVVAVFSPKLSSNPKSKSYLDYCRFALAKFQPWAGEYEEAWSGYDWESEEGQQWHIEEWQEFIEEVQARDKLIPDQLRHEIDWYARNSKELESDGQMTTFMWLGRNLAIMRNSFWSGVRITTFLYWKRIMDRMSQMFSIKLSSTYDSIVENLHGTTRVERPLISEEQMSRFNEQQCLAHDTIVRAITTKERWVTTLYSCKNSIRTFCTSGT